MAGVINHLLIQVIWCVAQILPRQWHFRWARTVGRLIYWGSLRRRRVVQRNLAWCFPDIRGPQKRALNRAVVYSTGLAVFDTLVAWFWTSAQIKRHIPHRIVGLTELLDVQKSGDRGVLLLAKHAQHLELDARLVGMYVNACAVGRGSDSYFVDAMMSSGRARSLEMASRSNPRQFVTWLKDKRTVIYYPDQDYGKNRSIDTTWFGVPAVFTTAPYTLQRLTGCYVFFLNSYYEGVELVIELERLDLPKESACQFTQALSQYIENTIARHPAEYIWGHRRFKSTKGVESYE